MSIRFAGSRSVDERRRRRLAQEADVATTSPRRRSGRKATAAAAPAAQAPDSSPAPDLPTVSIIPRQWWKHGVLAVICLAALAAVVAWGHHLDQAGSGLAPALGLKAGRMARFFSTVALLAAGQLSLLVLWYRAKSRKDFDGRYRIWFWAAVVWLVFCAAIATDAHRPTAQLILERWPLHVYRAPLLVWMVPASTIALAMTRLLRREMRACRASRYVLNLATASGALAALTLLGGDLLLTETAYRILLRTSTMAWHLGIALATLFHARYVIHVTNEPLRAQQRPKPRLLQPVFEALRHVRRPHLQLPRLPRLARLSRARSDASAHPRRRWTLQAAWPSLKPWSVKLPSFTQPAIRLPRLTFPKLSLPKRALPNIALPELSLPKRPRVAQSDTDSNAVTSNRTTGEETQTSTTGMKADQQPKPAPAAGGEAPAPQVETPKSSRTPARKAATASRAKASAAAEQLKPDVRQAAPPVTPQRKAPERKPPPAEVEPPQRKAPVQRVDPPQALDEGPHVDFEDDRSLSKKERRRLRKLKRQAKRQKARSVEDE